MSAAWIILSTVVAFAALATGEDDHQASVTFPRSDKCGSNQIKPYGVEFQSITIGSFTFTRYLVKDTTCVRGSESKVLDAKNALECAFETLDTKYNSFIYDGKTCTAYTYFAWMCRAAPDPKGDGTDKVVYIIDKKLAPYRLTIVDYKWLTKSDTHLEASFRIIGLCNVRTVVATMVNGTTREYRPQEYMTVSLPLDEPTCDGQDLTISLEDGRSHKLYQSTFKRNVCQKGHSDACTHCIGARSDDKDSFSDLAQYCQSRALALPTITTPDEADKLLQVAEVYQRAPFWIGYSKGPDNIWRWTDGSTDISQFVNAADFTPSTSASCAVADVDFVTMRLKIDTRQCSELEHGFCFTKAKE